MHRARGVQSSAVPQPVRFDRLRDGPTPTANGGVGGLDPGCDQRIRGSGSA